jgi:hypothetical protein
LLGIDSLDEEHNKNIEGWQLAFGVAAAASRD